MEERSKQRDKETKQYKEEESHVLEQQVRASEENSARRRGACETRERKIERETERKRWKVTN